MARGGVSRSEGGQRGGRRVQTRAEGEEEEEGDRGGGGVHALGGDLRREEEEDLMQRVKTVLSSVVFRSCSDGGWRQTREWITSAQADQMLTDFVKP